MLLSQAYGMIVCWQWKKIPVEALWGLGVPLLLGGGRSVAEAMVFAMIADVVPDKKRAIWFQWIVAAVLLGQLLGPLLAGVLVQPSIWLPLWISLGLITFGGVILAAFTPETLRRGQAQEVFDLDSGVYPSGNVFDHRLPEEKCSTWATLRFIFKRPMIWLLPGAVLTIPLATIQSDISIRLMPIQFDWRLDQSILLISLRSLATLVTLSRSHLCSREFTPLPRRDLSAGFRAADAVPRDASRCDGRGAGRDHVWRVGGLGSAGVPGMRDGHGSAVWGWVEDLDWHAVLSGDAGRSGDSYGDVDSTAEAADG
ncbi:hypothetical protein CEP51_011603 [Fusarium floridanum]|uniref:Major facilitator superfamily (MFS) profile domain-containing protein n=1 Tax=Fusarium floridanum TaxID=1325733 RepID=A0A428R9X2_9HYPO|nr:hypothetical protein CEP51_011603 [Fusarium floridanum]